VRYGTAAVSVSVDGVVGLADGTSLTASHVVVSAGAWLGPLLAPVVALPPLQVTEQQVFHFPRVDTTAPPWPSVIHELADGAVYHLAGGRDGGVGDDRKVGEHDRGRPTTATMRPGVIDDMARERITAYVSRWLPGLVPEPCSETTCLYTETESEDFVLDRIGPLVICSPCSGHGAKFAPLIGEMVASLVCEDGSAVPPRFRLDAHASGLTGAVSL
jgi:sarcosine oxidase